MHQDPIIPAEPTNTTLPPTPDEPIDEVYIGEPDHSESGWKTVLTTLAFIAAAPIIAVLLTAFVFQSYEVDGPSMESTLQNHDRLIVWKMPRTLSRITRQEYVPARGEVIVFVKHGLYENGGEEKQLIKRVIGVPGDRVVVTNGSYTIYNDEHPEGFDPDKDQKYSGDIIKPTNGTVDITIREDEVFVSGDNRGNSLDSRAFGVVSSNDIVGRMVLRIFPPNKFDSFI